MLFFLMLRSTISTFPEASYRAARFSSLEDPGTQLERGMEGRELMFASVSTSESHRYRMRYIGVFMMAIQDFKRAAGTLNRSRTTRTYIYIDSGGAWIEKTGIRGRGCAYSYSCVLRFNFAFAPYPEWL